MTSAGIGRQLRPLLSATARLVVLLETGNLPNGALIRGQGRAHGYQRLRGEAIHALKSGHLPQVRQLYWALEPELFTAMRANSAGTARMGKNFGTD